MFFSPMEPPEMTKSGARSPTGLSYAGKMAV